MSRTDSPFPHAVELPGCRLEPLEEGTAVALAERLAAIDPWRALDYRAATLAAYLRRHDPALSRWQVTVEGAVAGVVAVRYPWLRGPYLELLGLVPEAQGRGLGGDFVAWLAAASAGLGGNLWVLVSDFNQRARTFYARHGFVEVAPVGGVVTEEQGELLLRRRVGAVRLSPSLRSTAPLAPSPPVGRLHGCRR